MNDRKRFTARTSRDALSLVRQAFGDDAVVLSTKPCAEGVEVLAMAPEGMPRSRRMSSRAARRRPARAAADAAERAGSRLAPGRQCSRDADASLAPSACAALEPSPATPVEDDVTQPVDEHAVVPGLRARAHAQAPPGRDQRGRALAGRAADRCRPSAAPHRHAQRPACCPPRRQPCAPASRASAPWRRPTPQRAAAALRADAPRAHAGAAHAPCRATAAPATQRRCPRPTGAAMRTARCRATPAPTTRRAGRRRAGRGRQRAATRTT